VPAALSGAGLRWWKVDAPVQVEEAEVAEANS
jgi:hypothetical protein